MFNNKQFREILLRPTLKVLGPVMWSPAAEELMVATMAHESKGGTYLFQLGGPALGIYQMERATHDDIWENVIIPHPAFNVNMRHYLDQSIFSKNVLMNGVNNPNYFIHVADLLPYDHIYATMMARLQYWRHKEPLPSSDDLTGLYAYYKKYYNSSQGAATEQKFIADYQSFIRPI